MTWAVDGNPVHSILVTRLRYLGDIVMSTILVEVLRDGDPDLDIGYLCEDGFAGVLQDHPGIQRVHRLHSGRKGSDAKARVRSEGKEPRSSGTLGMIRELRQAGYDLVVDLFFNPRSAWLLRFSGIPCRIGGTRKWRGRLYTHQVLRSDIEGSAGDFATVAPGGLGEHLCRLAPLTHLESGQSFISRVLSRYRDRSLCPNLGIPALGLLGARGLGKLDVDPEKPFLLVAPNATWPSKEWPDDRWARLAGLLATRLEWPVVVLGVPGKDDRWGQLAAAIPSGRGGVLPPLPLSEALGVIAAARGLLTVDGGVMHAAVGMKVPTLALFGPTDPAIWFPYEQAGPFRVLARAPRCHPCDLHDCPEFICLPDLEPSVVLDAFETLLAESGQVGEGRP